MVAEPAVPSRKSRFTGVTIEIQMLDNQVLPSAENCMVPEVEVTVAPRASAYDTKFPLASSVWTLILALWLVSTFNEGG